MIEHVYKNSLSDCLKSKRIAENEVNPERVNLLAKLEENIDGTKVNKIVKYTWILVMNNFFSALGDRKIIK